MRNKKNKTLKFIKNMVRKSAMNQGFYDGRFKEKVVVDKRKKENKKFARKKIKLQEE